jgi:hypothetical protein
MINRLGMPAPTNPLNLLLTQTTLDGDYVLSLPHHLRNRLLIHRPPEIPMIVVDMCQVLDPRILRKLHSCIIRIGFVEPLEMLILGVVDGLENGMIYERVTWVPRPSALERRAYIAQVWDGRMSLVSLVVDISAVWRVG